MLNSILNNLTNSNLESITGLDAAFLYGETPTSPMHVGSVGIVEGSIKFAVFKEIIMSRIHQFPRLRQRLMNIPFSIDYPYWVDDPNFDINLHIKHIALPKPGSWSELRSIASSIFSEPLDRSRPLWHFTFVEGIDDIAQVPKGSIAIISKIHHVAVDGMAGAGLLSLLFDANEIPKELKKPKEYKAAPLPSELSLVATSALSFAKNPLKFPKIIAGTIAATARAGVLSRVQRLELPTAPFTAPKSKLNGIISAQRKWNSTILSLDRVKTLKQIMGTTLNDVILAICSGALRRYLMEKNELPSKPLIAMIPISTRKKDEENPMGNVLSNMLVQLATTVEDPIERLEMIYENTSRGKTYQNAIGAKTLTNLAEMVPFGVANQAAKMYSRYRVAKLHNPAFNVVITNVPGPQFPLYLQGHKLFAVMGMAPILDGMGLIITIFSYNGQLIISPTSDSNSMPDIDVFSRYIRESANELEEHILKHKEGKNNKKSSKKSNSESDAFFEKVRQYLKAKGDQISAGSGIFQFNISGNGTSHWTLNLDSNPPSIKRGTTTKADATFTVEDKNLLKIVSGKLKVPTAVIQGRLAITGDYPKALNLGKILSKMQKDFAQSA